MQTLSLHKKKSYIFQIILTVLYITEFKICYSESTIITKIIDNQYI